MTETFRFDELTRTELRYRAQHSTVVVPLGSTEQHGPHLPVSTDTVIVTEVVKRAAGISSERIPVLVLPTQTFGFAHHHLPFGGTISIDQQIYSSMLSSIGRSLATIGFTRILFVNGHGGNVNSMKQAIDQIAYEQTMPVHVGATSYWECAKTALESLDVGPTPGHAGTFETSCMLALRPDLVRTEAIPAPEDAYQPLAHIDLPGGAVRNPGIWQVSDGRTDDSRNSSAVLGEQILGLVATELANFFTDFHRRT